MVAAGATPAGSTPWTLWTVTSATGGAVVIGVTTEVDTSAARFGITPEYQAQLRGQRFISPTPGTAQGAFIIEGMTLVSAPRRDGFTFSVFMPRGLTASGGIPVNPESLFLASGTLREVVQDNWSVVWVGVEG
jgi:hypothetical protein